MDLEIKGDHPWYEAIVHSVMEAQAKGWPPVCPDINATVTIGDVSEEYRLINISEMRSDPWDHWGWTFTTEWRLVRRPAVPAMPRF